MSDADKPALTGAGIVVRLRELGLQPGDIVLTHSSLSGLGWVNGGAETVIRALLETVSPGGTVLFPTLTGTERDGPDCPPVMDVRKTSCWTGIIPRTALRWAGSFRSLHPTHSITAIGADADFLTAGHERVQTPCGSGSPYVHVMNRGGKILLLGGVTQESNTSIHALEELAGVPYHLQESITHGVVIDRTGTSRIVPNRLHQWGWGRDFGKVQPILERAGASRTGAVGATNSTLMDAAAFRDILLPILRNDPLYLLSGPARLAWNTSPN